VEKIRGLKIKGIGFEPSSRRIYPSETLGCHVVGWSGTDGGQEGIELRLDSLLRGVPGYHRFECDAARRTISRGEGLRHTSLSQPARPGLTVRLTVHAGIQHVVEAELRRIQEAFKPQAAMALVMDVGTGAVLAMASSPAFDPNAPARSVASARRNRTLTDQFEPGSIFKSFIAAAALDHGLYSRNSRFFCENGAWRRGYRVLHDSHAYGYLTFDEVIIKSSNIGAAKMGLRLGKRRVYECVKAFGFGDRTRIDLAGEARGRVRPLASWRKDSLLSIPMGQEIAVTPLQMVCAYAALLNGGVLLRPQIVAEITNQRGEELYRMRAQPVRRVITTRTSRAMRSILHQTVVKGTGRRAWCREYAIGGKTGTAQKVVNGRYSHEKYVASFCGFAPVEHPRLVCLVAADAPVRSLGYYGGTVSAPAVRAILRRALNALGIRPRGLEEQDRAEKIFKKRGG
jgi:cell division protein FtsI/penicillin-binding protein 2